MPFPREAAVSLEEILELFREDASSADYWHFIPVAVPNSRGEEFYRAVFKPDVALALEWGLSTEEIDDSQPRRRTTTEWSKPFPDPEVTFDRFELFFGATLVYRENYAVVDGARAYIPVPEPVIEGVLPNQEIVGYAVTEWETSLVSLLNALVHTTDTEDYVRRAGLNVINKHPLAP